MTPRLKATTKEPSAQKKERYFQAKGGRKTARAVARLSAAKRGIEINGAEYKKYFRRTRHQVAAAAPLETLKITDKIGAVVRVAGGGINAQAEAVRNAIARALVKLNETYRISLRQAGFLTRDARMVERKKYGLKKARRAPQWAKR